MRRSKEIFMEEREQEAVQDPREEFISQMVERFKTGEEHLSYTAISQFKKSPKSFVDYKINPKETSDAMALGSLVHCLVLTPDLFDKKYFVFDDTEKVQEIGGGNPRATKLYKEWKKPFIDQAGDKILLSDSDYKSAKLMSDAILTNSSSKAILDKCPYRETKVKFKVNGLPFIGFIDAMGNEAVADIKICTDADPKKFQRTIIYDGYYLQGGVYLTALEEMKPYYLIAVDRTGAVSVHLLMDTLLEYGMNEFDRLTREFNDCLVNNDFHKSYEYRTFDGIYKVDKPPYI